MKFILRLVLITSIGYFSSFVSPWWIIMVLAFIIGFMIPGMGFNVFLAGLLGGGLVWMGYSYKLYSESQGYLSDKMINVMGYSDPILLVLAAGVIGGLAAAFAGATGNSFRKLFMKKVKKSFYN